MAGFGIGVDAGVGAGVSAGAGAGATANQQVEQQHQALRCRTCTSLMHDPKERIQVLHDFLLPPLGQIGLRTVHSCQERAQETAVDFFPFIFSLLNASLKQAAKRLNKTDRQSPIPPAQPELIQKNHGVVERFFGQI